MKINVTNSLVNVGMSKEIGKHLQISNNDCSLYQKDLLN